MHGKAAEFLLQIHGDHPLAPVLCRFRVNGVTGLFQLRNGDVKIDYAAKQFKVGDTVVKEGDVITLDGSTKRDVRE